MIRIFQRFFVTCLIASGISACSTIDTEALKAQTAAKPLVMVSGLDSQLHLVWVGTTVFNNESQDITKPEWQLAERVEKALQARLESSGRFTSVKLVTKRGASRADLLKALEGEKGVALLLTPAAIQDQVYSTSVDMRGNGEFQRTAFGLKGTATSHVMVNAEWWSLDSNTSLANHVSRNYKVHSSTLVEGARVDAAAESLVQETLQDLADRAGHEIANSSGFAEPK